MMFSGFDWDYVIRYWPMMMQGVRMTIILTTLAVAIGTCIGLFVSLLRLSKFKPANWLAKAYVDFFRGTPLLVQIFIVFYASPEILSWLLNKRVVLSAFTSGAIALSLNSGAYIAEIFRGGIQSIDRGQMEAARSLGMPYSQAMRYIILPQAFKRSIPPLGNEFIAMLKDSSLVSVISVQELMMTGRIMYGRTYRVMETWLPIAFLYLIMTMTISQFVAYLERRFGRSDRSD